MLLQASVKKTQRLEAKKKKEVNLKRDLMAKARNVRKQIRDKYKPIGKWDEIKSQIAKVSNVQS